MSDFDVLVVGEINADLILLGDVEPAFGQVEKVIGDATLALGSSSCIFACGAAKLGLKVAFCGKVGDDAFGRFMTAELRARGIDTSGVVVDASIKTGLTVILSKGNDRAMLTYLGAMATFRYDEIDPSLLARARHLHIGSYFLHDALKPDVPRLFDGARAQGMTISIDANYDPAEQWNGGLAEALARADIFLPNETELRAIAGEQDVAQALEILARRTPIVAVKQGERGATARRAGEIVSAPSLPVNVVDTTGAGDSFNAGFVYGYLAGWSLVRSLRLGCVCGALSTEAAGGAACQPTLDEALARM